MRQRLQPNGGCIALDVAFLGAPQLQPDGATVSACQNSRSHLNTRHIWTSLLATRLAKHRPGSATARYPWPPGADCPGCWVRYAFGGELLGRPNPYEEVAVRPCSSEAEAADSTACANQATFACAMSTGLGVAGIV